MTRIDLGLQLARSHPSCLGVGFVALDIVQGQHGDFAAPGGSCGNVMSLLAWMGWRAAPAARLGTDAAGKYILSEFKTNKVITDYLDEETKVATPIVVQKFVNTRSGERTHRFSLTCPDCGSWLPRYRPLTLKQADKVIETEEPPKVFYFDRVSPASLKLAEWARNLGAMIVFEPSSIGDERPFQRAIDVCHILKFSHERLGHVLDLATTKTPRIIVETMGDEGLRVRWRSRWSNLSSFQAPHFADAAGSGDWCSAALIHRLGQKGASGLDRIRKPDLQAALRFGQAVAAINCGFEGARGAMLTMSQKKLNKALQALQIKDNPQALEWDANYYQGRKYPTDLCGSCNDGEAEVIAGKKRA